MSNIIKQIDKIIESQNKYRSLLEGNEAQTKWMLIDVMILDLLGYSRSDIIMEYNIDSFDSKKHNKLDYAIISDNKPKLLIEAKSLGMNLYEKRNQLKNYFDYVLGKYEYIKNELIGILTDGDKYLFYTNSVNENKMDNVPFYAIQLSTAEDFEKEKLQNYSKSNIKKQISITFDEEYEQGIAYRIDMLEKIFDYFELQGKKTNIANIYLNGRLTKNKNLKSLYRELIKIINIKNPELIYNLAKDEDKKANGNISLKRFSLSHISSEEFIIDTKYGDIYISLPSNMSSIIERIIYISQISGFGIQNISVSVK